MRTAGFFPCGKLGLWVSMKSSRLGRTTNEQAAVSRPTLRKVSKDGAPDHCRLFEDFEVVFRRGRGRSLGVGGSWA
ncbi:hypothetical protein HDF10_002769 [Edaphobacter lichenicola]|uniref:Uncharacterized protein n=1 Tax=Tunturiibacter lichenicola TaxID=2051959 RepID=A0A7W8J8U8_9BACT|nr:hypothetical protein [Edaphobacter lichenicola]